MTKYRTFGKLDDQFVTEGDTFFTRMNARLRPNQLQPGEVALSKNGRMNEDGTWQTRKGLNTLFGSITTGNDAIRLPWVATSAQRQSGVVTITLNATPSLAFIPGENVTVADLGFSSDSPNGTFPLASVNFNTKTITYISSSFVLHNGDFYKCLQDHTSSSSTEPGTSGGAAYWSTDTNASEASAWSASSVAYNGPGADEPLVTRAESVGNTSVVQMGNSITTTLNFVLADDEINEVYGSAVYSDPNSNSDDYILTATNNVAIILRLKDTALFKARYEGGGETVDGPCGMVQGFNKMYIFRTRKTTLAATPALNSFSISSASQAGQVITVNTSSPHLRSVGDFITLVGLGNYTTNPNDVYQIETSSTNQFTVKMVDSQTKTFNVSGARAEYFADFSRVSNGTYTAPVYLTDTTATSSNGEVTMNINSHGLSEGDDLFVQSGDSPFDLFADQTVRVTSVPSVSIFSFNLDVANVSIGQAKTLTVSKPLAIGKGFIHQPASPFGVVHQRRLWLPFQFTSATVPSDRGIRDEIVASDIMDPDTFDVIGNQFRPSAGQSDYTVSLKPFTQDSLVIFNRKSIHLMTGVSGSLADVKTNVVTTEIGCSARKSVVQVANQIFFLSDQGIYSVEFFDEFNLRGTGTPISETIQPFIDRINQDYVHLSVGVYFNNRLWMAVPLDSSPGAGNATKLNSILVYNLLNQGFESIDSVNSIDFAIRDLLVGREGAQNALYLTTEEGGVHKVDAVESGDIVSVTAGQAEPETVNIISQLTSRQYDANQIDRKTFARGELHLKSGSESQSDGNISYISEDPDSTSTSTSVTSLLGGALPSAEDASIRLGIRKRGFGIQADFQPTQGRPFVRALSVDARISDRSRTSIS